MVDKKGHQAKDERLHASSVPLDDIREAIEKIRFGSVQLIIQDGKVVQIDTIDKKRLS